MKDYTISVGEANLFRLTNVRITDKDGRTVWSSPQEKHPSTRRPELSARHKPMPLAPFPIALRAQVRASFTGLSCVAWQQMCEEFRGTSREGLSFVSWRMGSDGCVEQVEINEVALIPRFMTLQSTTVRTKWLALVRTSILTILVCFQNSFSQPTLRASLFSI